MRQRRIAPAHLQRPVRNAHFRHEQAQVLLGKGTVRTEPRLESAREGLRLVRLERLQGRFRLALESRDLKEQLLPPRLQLVGALLERRVERKVSRLHRLKEPLAPCLQLAQLLAQDLDSGLLVRVRTAHALARPGQHRLHPLGCEDLLGEGAQHELVQLLHWDIPAPALAVALGDARLALVVAIPPAFARRERHAGPAMAALEQAR